ncbi:hypothetical protein Tco_1163482 [Tanacetum coccineum]
MMNGSNIGIQWKKANLFNEWERFTSIDKESIESYYQRLSKLMNDFKRNKHFPEKIASNLKFLNNLQPEWSRHVTIIHQTKDLHIADYTQLYDFLKYNQKEVDDLRAERLAKTQDPLALMANSNNPFNYPVFHPDLPLSSMNMGQDRQMQMVEGYSGNQFRQYVSQNVRNQNRYNVVQNVRNQVVQNAVQNSGIQNVRNQIGLIVVPGITNQNSNGNGNVVAARTEGNTIRNNGNQVRCYNYRGLGHLARNCTVRPRRRDATYLQTQLLIAQKEKAGIQLQAKEFDLMPAVANLDEIEEVNANCILMANLQQASTLGTQTDKAPIYDLNRLAEVPLSDNCYNNEIFNMFTQEEHVEQGGVTVEQHPATVEETRAYHESLFHNLAAEVEKVNSVNCKMKETNANLTTKLARYKNQEKCFEISQEKYDKLERSFKEKSTVSSLQEEKKRLKLDFKIREDELLDKQIQLENKIKELDNILAKSREELYFSKTSKTANVSKSISIPNEEFSDDTTPSVARKFLNEVKSTIVTLQRVVKQKMTLDIHNWSSSIHQEIHKIVKDEIFPIVNQVDARVQNFKIQFLKEAAKFIPDFQSLAEEADESLAKHKALELEIERLLGAIVSQDIMSIVQNNSVVDTSNLQTELERTKESFENYIIKKENDKDTLAVSDILDPLSQKLDNENVELELQVQNYERENAHLKTAYKNLFDSINVTRTQTKAIIDSLQDKLQDTIYENVKLRSQLFDKVSKQKDTSIVTSNSAPSSREPNVVNNEKVIAPGIFRINPFKASRYVNGMKSRKKNQSANVSKSENQKKHKENVKKSKKSGSKESLASPSKPRSFLK